MIFLVRMDVSLLPLELTVAQIASLLSDEKEYSQRLQRDGRWRESWRVVDEYANISVFDVADNDELHELLSELPLFRHMRRSRAGSASR